MFNDFNQSALATALQHKKLKSYVYLRSKRFQFHKDEKIENLKQNLTQIECLNLTLYQKKIFPHAENSHIAILLQKSKLGFNHDPARENDYFRKIQNVFECLNESQMIKSIMQLIAKAKQLIIVFDFNRGSVDDVDLSKNQNILGTTYNTLDYILIGARNLMIENSSLGVIGTIAHEFTHYALHLTYNNVVLPYDEDDLDRQQEYIRVFKETYAAVSNK